MTTSGSGDPAEELLARLRSGVVKPMDLAGFLVYALLGLLFAYLFERSRSLVASWAAHAAFNVFNLMLLFALFG